MERISLNMQVGIGNKKSKTIAMFFSHKRKYSKLDKDYNKVTLPSTPMPITDPGAPKKNNLPIKNMKIIINRCYDKSTSTKDIKDDFGFITFTRKFTYLGSMISYDLDDFSDVILRIKNLTKLWVF